MYTKEESMETLMARGINKALKESGFKPNVKKIIDRDTEELRIIIAEGTEHEYRMVIHGIYKVLNVDNVTNGEIVRQIINEYREFRMKELKRELFW